MAAHAGAVCGYPDPRTALTERTAAVMVNSIQRIMNGKEPVTRAELADSLERLKVEILDAVRGMLHETETKLLTAFFHYQEQADIKFRKLTADVANINSSADQRINNLEQRVTAIEKRLLMG